MKLYKHLEIEGGNDSLKKCALFIDKLLKDSKSWIRDRKREKVHLETLTKEDKDVKEVFWINCPKTKRYPKASICLIRRINIIRLSRIKSKRTQELTYKEFNNIVDDFFNKFVKKATKATGVSPTLTKGEATAEELFGKNLAKLLKHFSILANKSTGSTHPNDQKRWFNFISAAHLENAKIDTDSLGRWLLEEEWPDEVTSDLICEYESSRDLLRVYDKERRKLIKEKGDGSILK